MGKKTLITGAIGASISLLGSFGLFNILLKALGLGNTFIDTYSDFLFLQDKIRFSRN